jgi:hypothetical protein
MLHKLINSAPTTVPFHSFLLSEQWGGRLGPRFGAHPTGGIRGKVCHWDSRPYRLSWIRKLGKGTALLTLSTMAFQTWFF